MDSAIFSAENSLQKAATKHSAKLEQVEKLKNRLETSDPHQHSSIKFALAKAEREAAEWAKKVATLTQHCEAIKSSRSQRSSDRTTAKVLRLQLKLRLLAQKHEILALQENAIREEISTLQG